MIIITIIAHIIVLVLVIIIKINNNRIKNNSKHIVNIKSSYKYCFLIVHSIKKMLFNACAFCSF